MRLRAKIAIGISGLLAALVVAATVFLMNFDINRLRPFIDDKVSAAIGRPFVINGNLYLTWQRPAYETGWRRWVPWPRLSAENISVANPGWAKNKQFATLQGVSAELSLLPLLEHRISVPDVQLVQPTVDIERLADGRNNWTFKVKPSGGKSSWTLDLGTVAFDKGTIAVSDDVLHIKANAQIDPLGKPVPFSDVMKEQSASADNSAGVSAPANTQDYVFGFKVDGSYNQAKVTASGKFGGVVSLTDASTPFPLQVKATVGDTQASVAGTLTNLAHLAALDLHMKLAGASMAHLYALTGIALPETPAYATAGHLRAVLSKDNSEYYYDDFTGRVGGSDLHGSLLFETHKPRPKLSGKMASNLLQFQDLAPLLGSNPKAGKDTAAADAAPVKAQPSDRLLPVAEFKTDRWQTMDADVTYAAKKITREATLPIENVSAHVVLDDGVLTLLPLKLNTAGGSIVANIRLDGSSTPLRGELLMEVRGLELPKLFPNIAQMHNALGSLNGDMRLKARGNSVAALAGTSDGEVKLLVEHGVISRNLLELAGLNVANVVVGKLFGDKPVDINCAAANLVSTNGVVDSRLFIVDTQDAQINVTGNVNLANEQMDFNVNPHTKGLRVFSLRSPLYVKGTFKNPDVGVDLERVALRSGAAVGLAVLVTPAAALLPLIAPTHHEDTPCGQLITQMCKPSSDSNPGKAAKVINTVTAKP